MKLRRVTGERHLQSLRATLQDEAWLRVKSPDGSYGPHWWQSVSTRGHWAGRILVFVELPKEKAQLAPYVVRAEQRLLGPDAQWEPLFGWPRHPSVAPKAAPRAAPKATPKALPRASPQRMTRAAFKPLCGPWKQHRGASVAPVKKFLKKAIKPHTNCDRSVTYWRDSLLRGRLHGQHFFSVDRSFLDPGGSRPAGGKKQHAASDEALSLIYATF